YIVWVPARSPSASRTLPVSRFVPFFGHFAVPTLYRNPLLSRQVCRKFKCSLGLLLGLLVPMEGLRASQQATHHDPCLRGISAPLLTAPLAKGIPAYSLLRLARQSKTQQIASALSRPSPSNGERD